MLYKEGKATHSINTRKTGGNVMKKVLLISVIALLLAGNANAGDHKHRDLRGVIVGAGGGALLGQAIGRNTQSTVIGTAIGSVVGYLVGSEMDRHHDYGNHVTYRQRQRVNYEYYEPVAVYKEPQVIYKEPKVVYKEQKPRRRTVRHSKCRETEILGTIDGKARRIYGTVCKTPQGWELVSQPDQYTSDYYEHSDWQEYDERDNRRHKEYRPSRWVRHRF